VEVERRVDLEALLIELPPELVVELLTDPLDKIRRDLTRLDASGKPQRVRLRLLRLRRVDEFLIAHDTDHEVAPLNGALGKCAWVVSLRALGQRREHGDLGEIQLAERLAEVPLGRCGDAISAIAEINLIEVELENSVLRIARLDGAGD